MPRIRSLLASLALVGVLLPSAGHSQAYRPERIQAPRFEAVAETQLIMEGVIQPNLRGIEKALRAKPADAEAWGFARGQALLVAEAGNLLLIRPPRNQGRDVWMSRSVELRETAAKLARYAAARDLLHSRETLADLAGVCNRCHETFRVAARVRVFGPEE